MVRLLGEKGWGFFPTGWNSVWVSNREVKKEGSEIRVLGP